MDSGNDAKQNYIFFLRNVTRTFCFCRSWFFFLHNMSQLRLLVLYLDYSKHYLVSIQLACLIRKLKLVHIINTYMFIKNIRMCLHTY